MAAEEFRGSPAVALLVMYSEAAAHLIYAAADVVLVPSLFEPCAPPRLPPQPVCAALRSSAMHCNGLCHAALAVKCALSEMASYMAVCQEPAELVALCCAGAG